MSSKRSLENEFQEFFNYFRMAITRLETMPNLIVSSLGPDKGVYAALDAIILACTYIDSLALFRYGEGKWSYIGFLQTYTSDVCRPYYRKVSCLYLDQPPLNKEGKSVYPKAPKIRNKLYARAMPNVITDLEIENAWRIVNKTMRDIKRRDLNQFSYAAYFYEHYRCYGVHSVQVPTGFGNREPYYQAGKLIFPAGFIMESLRTGLDKFEDEVLTAVRAGEHPTSENIYTWFKAKYGLKSRFVETRLK